MQPTAEQAAIHGRANRNGWSTWSREQQPAAGTPLCYHAHRTLIHDAMPTP
ncbi:MAG: hypothetical protein ACK443_02155 [Methylococcaceae bacterium]